MFRQDFIKRQIELFAAALARLAGAREKGDLEQASSELGNAYRALGVDPALLELDAQTIVRMLRTREKLEALCQLLEEHAQLNEAQGERAEALSLRTRAEAIRRAQVKP